MSNPSLLLVFTGLPGCGKTTLARQIARTIGIPIFSKDRFQSALVQQNLAPRATADGYLLILNQADEQLSLGVSCILDAVFPLPGFRQSLEEIATRHGAKLRVVRCLCSDEATWRQRMQGRTQYHDYWTPVGWEEVERLKAIYEPWPTSIHILQIDAINSPDQNFREVFTWLNDDVSSGLR